MPEYKFPKDFLWGAATSAHQIEGNNTNSDWWAWEQAKTENDQYPPEPSLTGCDSYNRYDEDHQLCQDFGLNSIRFSIEWARIEPENGKFAQNEIDHYRKVIQSAKNHGLKVFLTLHHFTNPVWFRDIGGWQSFKAPKLFVKYAKKVAEEFGEMVDGIITINEPQVYALMAYTNGTWPPNKKNYLHSLVVQVNMMRAHRHAYRELKKITTKPVGIAKNIVWYETDPFESKFIDRAAAATLNFLNDSFFLRPIVSHMDFIGLNYYFTARIRNLRNDNPTDYVSDLGWWINPGGLGNILKKLGKYKLPIYITENGLADAEDKLRKHFLDDMLIACGMAIASGIDLRGYFHWSLIDNYEWHHGFWPRFGLTEIVRENNLERKPRPSFYYYAEIANKNKINSGG